ncbi:hypothetical protein LCGC14_0466510 [marine sediment metagenome]|uniref:Uncharacterized protein n=1 Tax=marine sediment metagenome TaxID=412755 RepID=A0A0F9V0D5_9ZZZZ
MAYTKVLLSGSTNGRMIKVVPVATAGTLIHTAVAGSSDLDEIHLWAVNSDSLDVKLTIEYGGVASPDDLIEVTVPAEDGLYLIVPGLLLQNSLIVRAFAGTANVIMIGGYVNRIT